jgi:Ser/Thr protein kinase RdoA (MazF antagonist)
MAQEARIMEYLHSRDFPVPAIEEVSDDGFDLVMERIEGRSMVEAMAQAPWTIRRYAHVIAELHHRLHEVAPPDFLGPAPVGRGERILHLDLHPLNVLIGPKGPVVIDWTSACLGNPDTDVALAWVLMSAGEIPGGRVRAWMLGWGRSVLVHGFLSHFDRARLGAHARAVVEWKVRDPHMSAAEIEGMWRVVEQAEGSA